MAALIKDDGTLVETSFVVRLEGARRLMQAIQEPKKPTPQLVALMQSRKDRRDSK